MNPEFDDSLTCDFGCPGDAEMTRVDGHTVPLCGPCWADKTDTCQDCGERFWIAQMSRVFNTSNLFCPSCSSQYTAEDVLQALKRDEQRDAFNEVRR